MAYKANGMNTLHLNRPAVVVFKKPLATNEEMSQELQKLLGDLVPIDTHQLKEINWKGSKKATFYNPYSNKVVSISYNENIYFEENACTDEDTNLDTASYVETSSMWLNIGYKTQKLLNKVAYHPTINLPSFLSKIPKMLSFSLFKNSSTSYRDFLTEPLHKRVEDNFKKLIEYDRQNQPELKRTWYVFIHDSDFTIPDIEDKSRQESVQSSLYAKSGTNVTVRQYNTGEDTRGLDSRIVYHSSKVSMSFVKSNTSFESNANLQKELQDVPITSIHRVILQQYTTYNNPQIVTYEQAFNRWANYNKHFNGIEQLKNYSLIQVFENTYREWLQNDSKYDISIFEDKDLSEKVSTYNNTYYKIKLSDLFPGETIKDIIRYIDPNRTEVSYNLAGYTDLPKSISQVKYLYIEGDGGCLLFTKSVTRAKLYDAYVNMCKDLNDQVNGSKQKFNSSYVPSRFECLLRLKSQGNISGDVTFSNSEALSKVKKQFNFAKQYLAFLGSYNRAKIGSYVSPNLLSWLERDINPTNITMLDFKLLYYIMVKYNVVLPKYNILEENFMGNNKFNIVNMFPYDFFQETGSLESITVTNVGEFDVTEEQVPLVEFKSFNFEDIMQIPLENKKKLIDIYEQVYFGDWSGFYYTNSTTNNESIAKYNNTSVNDNTLTDIIKRLKQEEKNTDDKSNKDLLQEQLKNIETITNISNSDVASINISRQTMGKSTADILINSIDDKYSFKKGLDIGSKKGDCLFEPMDEVSIFLPTMENEITLAFKGYISSVENIIDAGYHSVSIKCDCPIKLLEILRTNIKPSISSDEAEDAKIHPFTVPEDMLKSVDGWVPFVFAQSLTYMFSMLGDSIDTEKVYTVIKDKKDKNLNSPEFKDPLLGYLWYRRSQQIQDQNKAGVYLSSLIDLYTDTLVFENGKTISEPKIHPKVEKITDILYSNSNSNKSLYKKPEYYVFLQRRDNNKFYSDTSNTFIGRKLVAQFLGTLQPSCVLGVSDIPIMFSDWKTNMSILLDTAEKFNFFLYSNRYGVVRLCPPVTDMMQLSIVGDDVDFDKVVNENDLSYSTDNVDIVSKSTTTYFRESCDDSRIVNWMQLSGGFVESSSIDATSAGIATTVKNLPSIIKYGVHAQSQQAILGVKNISALRAYGMALLDRQNKNYRAATADTIGSGDLDINRTVYSAINDTIYLRTGLILTYKPGVSFTASSTLNWGRKPLFRVSKVDTVNDVETFTQSVLPSAEKDLYLFPVEPESRTFFIERQAIGSEVIDLSEIRLLLNHCFKSNKVTLSYYNQLSSLLDTMEQDERYKMYTPMFMFNGSVWDGVSSISFEDLSNSAYSNLVAEGFQLPLLSPVISSSDRNTMASILNISDEQSRMDLRNKTAVFVGMFDQADKATTESIYVSTDNYVLNTKDTTARIIDHGTVVRNKYKTGTN